jgi:hypothetical protein
VNSTRKFRKGQGKRLLQVTYHRERTKRKIYNAHSKERPQSKQIWQGILECKKIKLGHADLEKRANDSILAKTLHKALNPHQDLIAAPLNLLSIAHIQLTAATASTRLVNYSPRLEATPRSPSGTCTMRAGQNRPCVLRPV